MSNLTFHEVVKVAVVGAVVFDGIPGLRDGHGLETELLLYVLHNRQTAQNQRQTERDSNVN